MARITARSVRIIPAATRAADLSAVAMISGAISSPFVEFSFGKWALVFWLNAYFCRKTAHTFAKYALVCPHDV